MHHRPWDHSDHSDHSDLLEGAEPISVAAFHAFRHAMFLQKGLVVRELAEKGSHPGQAMCLWVLTKNDGISQSDLAEKLAVTRPTVTVMLRKMEKAGLIERVVDAEDQRYTRIHLTEAGRSTHEELQTVHAKVINDTIGRMSVQDQTELARLLRELSRHAASALHAASNTQDTEEKSE